MAMKESTSTSASRCGASANSTSLRRTPGSCPEESAVHPSIRTAGPTSPSSNPPPAIPTATPAIRLAEGTKLGWVPGLTLACSSALLVPLSVEVTGDVEIAGTFDLRGWGSTNGGDGTGNDDFFLVEWDTIGVKQSTSAGTSAGAKR